MCVAQRACVVNDASKLPKPRSRINATAPRPVGTGTTERASRGLARATQSGKRARMNPAYDPGSITLVGIGGRAKAPATVVRRFRRSILQRLDGFCGDPADQCVFLNVFGNHRARRDDCVFSNRHALCNRCTGANPRIPLDVNSPHGQRVPTLWRKRVPLGEQTDLWANKNGVLDRDAPRNPEKRSRS